MLRTKGKNVNQELGLTHLLEPALPENRICNPENDKVLLRFLEILDGLNILLHQMIILGIHNGGILYHSFIP